MTEEATPDLVRHLRKRVAELERERDEARSLLLEEQALRHDYGTRLAKAEAAVHTALACVAGPRPGSFVDAIGKWPGDESDEEIEVAIRDQERGPRPSVEVEPHAASGAETRPPASTIAGPTKDGAP